MDYSLRSISSWQDRILKSKSIGDLGASLYEILFDEKPKLLFVEIKFSGVLPWLGPTSLLIEQGSNGPKVYVDYGFQSFKKKAKPAQNFDISLKLPSWDPGVLFLSWTGETEISEAKKRLKVLGSTLSLALPNLALGEVNLPFKSRSKDFFQALLENSSDFIIFMMGKEAKFVSSNCKNILGYSPYELMALINDNMALVHPEDLPQLAEKIEKEQKQGKAFGKHEYRIRNKAGDYVWFEWLVHRFFDKDGNFSHSILNCRDVSGKIEAEEEILRQRNILDEILDLIPVDVFIKDEHGRYLFVNKSVCKSLAVNKSDLIGKNDSQVFNKEEAASFKRGDDLAWQNQKFENVEEKTYINGRERIYLTNKSTVNLGGEGRKVLLGTSLEVTDRIKSERTARENSDLINNIAQLIPESLFVYDLEEDKYVYSNFRLFKKLGYQSKDYTRDQTGWSLDMNFLKMIFQQGEFERYKGELEEIREGKKDLYEAEYLIQNSKGEDVFILSRKLPYKRNAKGKVTQFVGLTIDITDQKKRERELEKAKSTTEKALKTKDEFLSVMSHEIRTPLNAIIGISNLMKENPNLHLEERIRSLKFSADKLLLLVNDILDFSKIQSGKMSIKKTSFDLDHLTENIYQTFVPAAAEKGIKFNYKADKRIDYHLVGDEGRISQVLFNLISNAIKFTEKGKIDLKVIEKQRKGRVAEINIEVKDTGIGIPKDDLEKIFDPFHQLDQKMNRHHGGTGLGLAISKRICEEHGGRLVVKSKEGKGSLFRVILPLKLKTRPKDKKERSLQVGKSKRLSTPSVLYVEDVTSNRDLMRGFADMWGFKLSLAGSGKECMQILKKDHFDLILLDIQMPGMDGFEVFKGIKKRGLGKTKVVAITADASEKTALAIKKVGIDGILLKPFDLEDLRKVIYKRGTARGIMKDVRSTSMKKASTPEFGYFRKVFPAQNTKYFKFLSSLKTELEDEIIQIKEMKGGEGVSSFKRSAHKLKGALGNSAHGELKEVFSRIRETKSKGFPESERDTLQIELENYMKALKKEISSVAKP